MRLADLRYGWLALGAAATLALTGCAADPPRAETETLLASEAEQTPAEEPHADTGVEEVASPAPYVDGGASETPAPPAVGGIVQETPAPPGSVGRTRETPAPAGQVILVGDWVVRVHPSNLDAWSAVQAASRFNDPPPEGYRYVMAQVDVHYLGEYSETPAQGMNIKVEGAGGSTYYRLTDGCGLLPDPELIDVKELGAGATATGNVCVAVHEAQLSGAAWLVEPGSRHRDDCCPTYASFQ